MKSRLDFVEWEFDHIYKTETAEGAVLYAKQAMNAGFKPVFKLTGDPDWPYGFILVDPFEEVKGE